MTGLNGSGILLFLNHPLASKCEVSIGINAMGKAMSLHDYSLKDLIHSLVSASFIR